MGAAEGEGERGPTTNTRRGGGVRRGGGRGGKIQRPRFRGLLLFLFLLLLFLPHFLFPRSFFTAPPLSPLHMVASFSRNELHIANCCAPLLHFQRASRQIIAKILSTCSFETFLFSVIKKKKPGGTFLQSARYLRSVSLH